MLNVHHENLTANSNYFYINVYLGKNKKKQSLILDTGSFITAVACQPFCEDCGFHINSYYTIPSNYSIFKNSYLTNYIIYKLKVNLVRKVLLTVKTNTVTIPQTLNAEVIIHAPFQM